MGNSNTRGGGAGRDENSVSYADSGAANPLRRPSVPTNHNEKSNTLPASPSSGRLQSTQTRGGGGPVSALQPSSVLTGADRQAQLVTPEGAAASPGGARSRDTTKTGRRVSVAVTELDDAPQRHAGSCRVSTTLSFGSFDVCSLSRGSSDPARPRMSVNEARDLLLSIFVPRRGGLECIASGFMTYQHYAKMLSFWVPFLTTELRDKWYLDAVMLSVLGKDRWRSSRQQKEVIMSVAPSREEVLRLNQQRREYSDVLRERLMDISGALLEQDPQRDHHGNLQALLNEYNRHKVSSSALDASATKTRSGGEEAEKRGLRPLSASGSTSSPTAPVTVQAQELSSVSLMRLQTSVSTSFDCFDLLASRIPTNVISSLPSQYLLGTTPVVYEAVAYQEKKIGDLDAMSFFVSIESRRRLLHGLLPADVDRDMATAPSGSGGAADAGGGEAAAASSSGGFSASRPTDDDQGSPLRTAQHFFAAVRHAGLVLTTACSSMVLTVLFHVADVLRERQAWREHKAKAARLGIPLEQLIGRKAATVRAYTGKTIDDLDELKHYAITGEMSLTMLTRQLVLHFRNANRAKIEKLRKRYPNVFAFLEMSATPEERDDFDVTRLLGGLVLKLMFLTGGGQRSIVADDRRVPGNLTHTTDDVALSTMLEVPILNRICWMACMMGMPIMTNHGLLSQKQQGKPLSFIELDECCGVMRTLFQAVGALPCGNACPQKIKEWFPLFPFYAVGAEGKRVLMYLYTAQATAIQRAPVTVQKDMTLLSFATAFKNAKDKNRVDIANYFFEPNFTVGCAQRDGDEASACGGGSGNHNSGGGGGGGASSAGAVNSCMARVQKPQQGSAGTAASPSTLAVKGRARSSTSDEEGLQRSAVSNGLTPPSCSRDSDARRKMDFEYMTAVGAPTSPSQRGAGQQAADGKDGRDHRNGDGKDNGSDDDSDDSVSSCSTLMEENLNIDVYTCVSPQAQLYMRCSNEATMRRHRVTELTPSVSATFLCCTRDMQAARADIAPALHQAVPKLLPSEGFLTVRWTSGEPLVTFCAGDIISVMAERVATSVPGGGGAPSASGDGAGSAQQPLRSTSARYFTGATRRASDADGGRGGAAASTSGVNAGPPGSSGRTHLVTIDEPKGGREGRRLSSISPLDGALETAGGGGGGAAGAAGGANSALDFSFYGYATSLGAMAAAAGDDELASLSGSGYAAPESTRAYQGFLHDLFGVNEKVSRRVAVRWQVLEVLPCSQLIQRSRRMAGGGGGAEGNAAAAAGKQCQPDGGMAAYRHEVVLHVAAPDMPVAVPLRILTIGHERACMSVFSFVSQNDDSVCWSNPLLIDSILRKNGASHNGLGDSVNTPFSTALSLPSSTSGTSAVVHGVGGRALPPPAAGPLGLLCNTEEALHNVFYSIGVLLGNAITNGVYFTAPIAPLAFLLMKKAISSGDYSFKSFMWLQPADGNLLSPVLVLNSAYEILNMTEHQYVVFLQSRSLATPESQIFPVMNSLADELKEDRLLQQQQQQQQGGPHKTSCSSEEASQMPHQRWRSQQSGDGGALDNNLSGTTCSSNTATRERSGHASCTSASTTGYLKLIDAHNRKGSTFHRSAYDLGGAAGRGGGGGGNELHPFLLGASVPVQDRLQGYRDQRKATPPPPPPPHQQALDKGSGGGHHNNNVSGSGSGADAASLTKLFAQLPSRREYISLYLVNDLAWGSVRRDGHGEKNKELWVSMARGFMTSSLAKSPLMTHCCSRVICEVLCVPGQGG